MWYLTLVHSQQYDGMVKKIYMARLEQTDPIVLAAGTFAYNLRIRHD